MKATITIDLDKITREGDIHNALANAASTLCVILDQHKRHPEYRSTGHSVHASGDAVGWLQVDAS